MVKDDERLWDNPDREGCLFLGQTQTHAQNPKMWLKLIYIKKIIINK